MPEDSTVSEGSYTLSWTAVDEHPATYTITHNGVTVKGGNWQSGVPVTYDTGFLSAGQHIFTITFYDENGNGTSHTVVLTVSSSATNTVLFFFE